MLNNKLAQFAVEDDFELDQVIGGAGAGRHGRIMGKVRQQEGKTVYTVGLGDTLKNIADYFQTTKETILSQNAGRIQNEAMLFPDTELIIC